MSRLPNGTNVWDWFASDREYRTNPIDFEIGDYLLRYQPFYPRPVVGQALSTNLCIWLFGSVFSIKAHLNGPIL